MEQAGLENEVAMEELESRASIALVLLSMVLRLLEVRGGFEQALSTVLGSVSGSTPSKQAAKGYSDDPNRLN
jgi:hypothetical protein